MTPDEITLTAALTLIPLIGWACTHVGRRRTVARQAADRRGTWERIRRARRQGRGVG